MSGALAPPSGWTAALGRVPRILHMFSTFAIGGPQRRFATIANHFGPKFRHLIWPLDGCADARSLLSPDSSSDVLIHPFPKQNFFRNALTARRNMHVLQPDVLVTYNWGAMEWAAGNILKLANHVHIEDGFGPEEAERQLPRRVWFRRLILNRHSAVAMPSRRLVDIATHVWRIDPERIVYLPNGIDCRRYLSPPEPAFLSAFAARGPVIGTVATLRREKALGRLIDAFAILRAARQCHLVIAGDGGERKSLEQHVATAGLSDDVTFTGYIDRPERILRAFDVFALSSDTEQMPLSILEAMAAGLPIASTNAGDISNMLAAENLPFVVTMSAQKLAAALATLLDDQTLRNQLGVANQEKVIAQFDEDQMLNRYGELFNNCKIFRHPLSN